MKSRFLKSILAFLLLLFTMALFNPAKAQEDKTVTLTVSGQGKTLEDAKQNALRNAIEQAFGTFISSKTEVLNDNLISDQITSISNGNIQKFEVISAVQIPAGDFSVTLTATVSVTKLIAFAESKGVAIEFKGSLLAVNIKQQILNERNEANAVKNLCQVLKKLLDKSIDYSLTSNEPKAIGNDNENWSVPITVDAKFNSTINLFKSYLFSSLKAIALPLTEQDNYKRLVKPLYTIAIGPSPTAQKEYVIYKEDYNSSIRDNVMGVFYKTTNYSEYERERLKAEKKNHNSALNLYSFNESWIDSNNIFTFRTIEAATEVITLINSTLSSILKFEVSNGVHTIKGVDLIEAEQPKYHSDYDIKRGFEATVDLKELAPFLAIPEERNPNFFVPRFTLKGELQDQVRQITSMVIYPNSGEPNSGEIENNLNNRLAVAKSLFQETMPDFNGGSSITAKAKDNLGYMAAIVLTAFNNDKESVVKIKFEDKVSLSALDKISEYRITHIE